MSNDSVIAGPLCKAATVPVSTKIPRADGGAQTDGDQGPRPQGLLEAVLARALGQVDMPYRAHLPQHRWPGCRWFTLLLADVIRPFADCAAPEAYWRASLSQARPPLVRTTARGGACASIARPATPVSPAILEEILT